MDKIEGLKRCYIPKWPYTLELDNSNSNPIDWTCAPTPYPSLAAIVVYNEWINRRLNSACKNIIPLTPSVSYIIKKRNKA
jgi:hypothetical protein